MDGTAAGMASSLYDLDALAWSEQQGGLLRRIAEGERLNAAVDWPNVIEEIEAMGRSELRSCGSSLRQAMVHLLKLRAWPGSQAAEHWRSEVFVFLDLAQRAFTPSMRRRINLDDEYRAALRLARFAMREIETPARPLPDACPFTLDELLTGEPATLLARLHDLPAQGT